MRALQNKIIDINKKTYVGIVIMLASLIVFSIIVTFIVPKGTFESYVNEYGEIVFDYTKYIKLPEQSGINIFKGIFSPILVLFSNDGISLFFLSLFILVIAGTFQLMSDTNGINSIVYFFVEKFKNKKNILIAGITLIFMLFGSFLGLFEEMLSLLPLIVMLTISLGYDGYTGFLVCIVACGFGFASAITNPFTVIAASSVIGVNPMYNLWYRILIFLIMYSLLLVFVFLHIKKISKNPMYSPTYDVDNKKREQLSYSDNVYDKKALRSYSILLLIVLSAIIVFTSIKATRPYSVVILTIIFLFGGLISGYVVSKDFKHIIKLFLKGVLSALPTILLILMASSIKYILEEGNVLATIANSISIFVKDKNPFVMALLIYAIITFIEFFVSSSTAKAVFVMGILSIINISLSKELLVLLYLFGDGYSNVFFPTSPVLLISLSLIGINYVKWIKTGKWLILSNIIMVICLILLAVLVY